ncbi:MAG: hypothetical protein MJ025_00905 [Victivallaceae bacterium]|nr:hypothetical protein [Victivallaceae bacterium]
MEHIVLLGIDNGIKLEAVADSSLGIAVDDMVVFARDYYNDVAEVVEFRESSNCSSRMLPSIVRQATPEDLLKAAQNATEHRKVLMTTQSLVDKLGLPMKLVNAHYSVDRKLATVQFCADGRVDFRELVKELSRALCTRIELRQIGVRDETGMYGGIGDCGQPLCCCRFLHEFSSINVKMAKDQDLALTPSSISGICGRLRCCLKFEHDGYKEMEKDMPRKGEFRETSRGVGKVTDRNMLTRTVTLTFESGASETYRVDDTKPATRPQKNDQERPQQKKNQPGAGHNKDKSGQKKNGDRGRRNDGQKRNATQQSAKQPSVKPGDENGQTVLEKQGN